jgi:protein-arginine kinase activator protein McsA
MKKCYACQQEKAEVHFYKDRTRPDKLSSRCKECDSAKTKHYWRETYYPEHREEQKAAVVKRRRERKSDPSP